MTRPLAIILTTTASLAALPACSDPAPAVSPAGSSGAETTAPPAPADWPVYRGDPHLTGVAAGAIPDDLTLLWTFAAEQSIVSSPVIVDGRVFVGSDDGNVYALDLATGARVWSFATDDIVEAPPLVHDGTVYVGSSDFFLYALDAATGALRWKQETDDKILGGANWVPAPDGDGALIVVGSYDSNLYCFDAAGGRLRWKYETGNYVNGTPAVVGDTVVFGGCDATLHVVDVATGEPRSKVPLCPDCHVAGSVAVFDDHVYFGHYGNAFVAVDLERAEVAWSYPSPRFAFFSSPALTPDRVVFGGRDRQMHCASRADGSPLWTFPTRRKVDGSPVICGEKVVFGSGDGQLYVLDLADGTELWSYDIGRGLVSSPAVAGGIIVIGSTDGSVYAFGADGTGPSPDA